MEHYEVSTTIDAPPERVWEVLKAGNYHQWESGVAKLDGRVADGEKIKVWSEVSPSRAFPVKVALDESTRTMTWTGGMPIPGVFRGVRTFRVGDHGGGSTFFMREEFSGLMLGPIFRSMPDLQPSFDQFAAGLRDRAESAPSS